MWTSTNRSSAGPNYYGRGQGWGIPGEVVDGMDIQAVREAGARATEHARSGKGPYILELDTYRYRGHSMSDPAKYRSKEEVDDIKTNRDPIDHLKARMTQDLKVAENDFADIENRVKKIVLDAVEFSKNSPEPDASELYTDVLIEAKA